MKYVKVVLLVALALSLNGVTYAANQDAPQTESNLTVPQGPALTEGEVVILLQAKVPVEIIQKFVQTRGAGFLASKETGKRIIAAGGNVALVGTISLSQRDAEQDLSDQKRGKK